MDTHVLIQRKNGTHILLTPFLDREQVTEWDEQPLSILVSGSQAGGVKEDTLYHLYSLIDRAVDAWVQELKYIPRMLNSAAAFMVTYFFFSFVVRDPLPIIDELILASGAAVAVYLWTAGRNRRSDIAQKKRTELKELADQSVILDDAAAVQLEQTLADLDERPLLDLAEQITGIQDNLPKPDLGDAQAEISAHLLRYLKEHDREAKYLRKIERLSERPQERERLSAHLYALARDRKIDLPLVALYLSI